MPFSHPIEGKRWIRAVTEGLGVRRVLDVGAGSGTYSTLLRPVTPGARWSAIEVWQPYLDEFALAAKYDEVIVADVRSHVWGDQYDLVILGDVLEHMPTTDAVDVFGRAVTSSAVVLASMPIIHYPQGAVGGNPFEAHVKDDWNHEEIVETFPGIRAAQCYPTVGVYWAAADDHVDRLRGALRPAEAHRLNDASPHETDELGTVG